MPLFSNIIFGWDWAVLSSKNSRAWLEQQLLELELSTYFQTWAFASSSVRLTLFAQDRAWLMSKVKEGKLLSLYIAQP